MRNQKLLSISILRVIAMILVVFYHCICCYSVWKGSPFYSGIYVDIWQQVATSLNYIHVPTFFLIAGYLFVYKMDRKTMMGGGIKLTLFAKKKAKRVLVPYIIIGVFLCILQQREWAQLLTGISHLWFLLTIFECYIFFFLVERIFTKKACLWIIPCSLLFLVLYSKHPLNLFGIGPFFRYAPYYAIGMCVCRINLLQSVKRFSKIMIITASVLYITLSAFNSKHIIIMLAAIFLIVAAFAWLENRDIKKVPRFVTNLDKCSMGIYIVHHILIQEMNQLDCLKPIIETQIYMYPFIQFVVVFFTSWFIVIVLQHFKFSRFIIG